MEFLGYDIMSDDEQAALQLGGDNSALSVVRVLTAAPSQVTPLLLRSILGEWCPQLIASLLPKE